MTDTAETNVSVALHGREEIQEKCERMSVLNVEIRALAKEIQSLANEINKQRFR